MISTATLFGCPPDLPEVVEPLLLQLKLKLESLELQSDLSPPPSSGPCLLPSVILALASGACVPPSTRSYTATLVDWPPAPPESGLVGLALLETDKSPAEPEDDELFLLMPGKDSGRPLIMLEAVGPGGPDTLVGGHLGLGGL